MTSTFNCEKTIFHLPMINWSQGDHFGMLCLIDIWKKVVFCFKKCSDILCFKLTFVRLCMWGCMQDLRKKCWLFATHFITIFQSAIFTLYFFYYRRQWDTTYQDNLPGSHWFWPNGKLAFRNWKYPSYSHITYALGHWFCPFDLSEIEGFKWL